MRCVFLIVRSLGAPLVLRKLASLDQLKVGAVVGDVENCVLQTEYVNIDFCEESNLQ